MVILPWVKNIKSEKSGEIKFPVKLFLPTELDIDITAVNSVCTGAFIRVFTQENSDIIFKKHTAIEPQGYKIYTANSSVNILYSDSQGAFYALVTLWQIFKTEGIISNCFIDDSPDIMNRGFMLDISRGKVPTLDTLYKLADLLARFKYNQIQLYIEGFSFFYPSFSKYCSENSALKPEEIRKFDLYCRKRFIDLVPNQNSLGHMAQWLSKPEFAALSECVGGFSYNGFTIPPTTLDPGDKNSLDFVGALMKDLLPCFSSKKYHAGFDEPFELGRGKSKDKDLKQLILNYITEVNSISNSYGKEMMIWADTVHRFGCTDMEFPDNIIFMEWGYEKEYPFSDKCRILKETKKRFYVCPGTSSWLSFLGITDCMIANIDNAVSAGIENGAEGVLLTDWGDGNHMQYLPVSYPAIVYCAARSWNSQKYISEENLASALDYFVFEDESHIMGEAILDAGKYHLYEEFQMPCRTIAYTIYQNAIDSMEKFTESLNFTVLLIQLMAVKEVASAYPFDNMAIDIKKIEKLKAFLNGLKARLLSVNMMCEDSAAIAEEVNNAIEMVMLFTEYRACFAEGKSTIHLNERIKSAAERHRTLWLLRNKLSGLDCCVNQIMKFIKH